MQMNSRMKFLPSKNLAWIKKFKKKLRNLNLNLVHFSCAKDNILECDVCSGKDAVYNVKCIMCIVLCGLQCAILSVYCALCSFLCVRGTM